jgi:hypothetical protein
MSNILEMGQRQNTPRFGLIEQEQLAAQMVAVLDAHFKRPDYEEKLAILNAARQQVEATRPLQ